MSSYAARRLSKLMVKLTYTQAAPTGAGNIPRGSEMDINLQRILDKTGAHSDGFRGHPAPPDDSHPMLENDTYYRKFARKTSKQPPNEAFRRGEEGGYHFALDDTLKSMLAIRASRYLKDMTSKTMKAYFRDHTDDLIEVMNRAGHDFDIAYNGASMYRLFVKGDLNSASYARKFEDMLQSFVDAGFVVEVEDYIKYIPSDTYHDNVDYYEGLMDEAPEFGELDDPAYEIAHSYSALELYFSAYLSE